MGRRGPAPKPTAIRKAQGNPGKRALRDNEPVPPAGDIAPPKWLKGEGRKVWDELAPIARAMGTLTTADVLSFAKYCDMWEQWFTLRAAVRAGRRGVKRSELHKLQKDLFTIAREFGFTPASRSRIEIEHGGQGAAPPATGSKAGESDFEKDFPPTNPIPFTRTA